MNPGIPLYPRSSLTDTPARYKPIAMRITVVLMAAAALSSSVCHAWVPDLRGRFSGTQTENGVTVPVVGQVRDYIVESVAGNPSKTVTFEVSTILADSKAETYKITFVNGRRAILRTSHFGPYDLEMAQSGKCANGQTSGQAFKTCWNDAQLSFESAPIGESTPNFKFSITRNSDLPVINRSSPDHVYGMNEILGRAKFQSYASTQEVERVYQAKQSARVAAGNLLPRLNLRSIVGVATGQGFSLLETVENFLPFLFPSNWYRWQAAKFEFEADRQSLASLRGNQMNLVQGVYLSIQRDQLVLKELDAHIAWLKGVEAGLRQEEAVGTISARSADYFAIGTFRMESDRSLFKSYLDQQYAYLSQSVALSPLQGVNRLEEIVAPDLGGIQPIAATDLAPQAQQVSHELLALKFLLRAAVETNQEVKWGILSPEGVGLGFSASPTIQISRSRVAETQIKIDETFSAIELQAIEIASEYNAALSRYSSLSSAVLASQAHFEQLYQRHVRGEAGLQDQDFVDQLRNMQQEILELKVDRLSIVHGWMITSAKLDRLLLKGVYSDLLTTAPASTDPVLN